MQKAKADLTLWRLVWSVGLLLQTASLKIIKCKYPVGFCTAMSVAF